MLPIVVPKRAELKGGLWTPRAIGDFEEGATDTDFYISGTAEIKELQGNLKLFFHDVKIMHRRAPIDEVEEKPSEKPENEGEDVEKGVDTSKEKEGGGEGEGDDSDEDDEKKKGDASATVYEEKKKVEELVLDNPDITCLHLFFSKKNPKTRMVDVHKRGTKVYLNRYNPDGHFGKKGTLNDFEVSLKSIPDVLLFRGLVVVKMPADRPVTEDPVVYGYIKLQSARSIAISTANEMQFSEISDIISKATDGAGKSVAAGGGGGGGDQASKPPARKSSDRVKPLSHYRKIVKKAWLHFNLQDGDEVNLKQVMKILNFLNIFLLDIQAQRILEAVDLEGDRELGTSEMVNFLMAFDLLGPAPNIDCLDIFDTLKVKAAGGGLDFSGFCEALHMLGARADDEALLHTFCSSSGVSEKDADTAFIDLQAFKKGWIKLALVSEEMQKRGMHAEAGLLGAGRNRDRLFRWAAASTVTVSAAL